MLPCRFTARGRQEVGACLRCRRRWRPPPLTTPAACLHLPAGAWGSTSGAWGSTPAPEANGYGSVAPVSVATTAPVPAVAPVNDKGSSGGGGDLGRREAELNRREAELRKLELELRNNPGGRSVKNWPKFCPILHHDIAGEIPAANQAMVRWCYWAWMGLIWCMFFNFCSVTGALIGIGGDKMGSWLWSIIWALGGIPGAYILWYSRIYNAAIKDSAIGYSFFFAGFMANLVFSIWSAVGEPRGGQSEGRWRGASVYFKADSFMGVRATLAFCM